jgi:Cof subfamily protein (haloacid dehalogenase superfamily)
VIIEAVVTDLDGTIVRADGTITDETLRAAKELSARGIPLVAATARTPAGIRALQPLHGLVTLAVCCTGAIGFDPHDEAFLWKHQLPRAAVADLVHRMSTQLAGVELSAYTGEMWLMTSGYQAIRGTRPRGPIAIVPMAEIAQVDACTVAACHPHLDAPALFAAMGAVLAEAEVNLTYAGTRVVDVTPTGVNKASGVANALTALGIPAERAIAFGDMPNDIPMFAEVGYAVAMGNATEEVRAAATLTTASVDEDGFARCLRNLGVIEAT